MMHSKIDQAINFFENRNLNESKKLCLEILKDEPKNFDILHLLGIISFKLEDYKMSADLIGKAVTINPKNAEVYNNQSLVFKKINKLEKYQNLIEKFFYNNIWYDDYGKSTFSQQSASFSILTEINEAKNVNSILSDITECSLNEGKKIR